MRRLVLTISLLALPTAAQAGDSCQSAKNMVRMAKAFYAADPERTDVITPHARLRMKGINGAPDPDGIHYFYEDVHETLPVDENQVVQNIEEAARWSKDGKLCRFVDGKIPEPTEENTVEVNMNFKFSFNATPPEVSVETLREGLKDGSKIMNGVAPGGLGFAVPGLKSVVILKKDDAPIPVVTFLRKGKVVPVRIVTYDATQYVRMKDIKSAKAEAMRVEGDYILNGYFKFDPDEMEAAEQKRLALAQEEAAP